MLRQIIDLNEYDPTNINKIKSKKETLINAGKLYNNTRIMSLRRLKTGLFHVKMNFKKELDMSAKALPEWMKVTKKDLIGKK